jgi:hypothetical protein
MNFVWFVSISSTFHLIWKRPPTVTRQLAKSRAFCQNYLCDFHLWTGPNPLTWQECRMRAPAQSRPAWAPRSCWWAGSAASGPGATRSGSDRNSGPWIHTTTITFIKSIIRQKQRKKGFRTNSVADTVRIRIKLKGTRRIRTCLNLQMKSQKIWHMSQFEHFFNILSLYLEARIQIRIKVTIRSKSGYGSASTWCGSAILEPTTRISRHSARFLCISLTC